MRTNLYLRTQSELLADIEARLNDTGNQLATDAQYYNAINDAIRGWSKRVVIPHLYTLTFSSGVFEYALPAYIRAPFRVQIKTAIFGLFGIQSDNDDTYTFMDWAAYDIEPDGDGGFKLRLHSYPYAEEGRIIWYSENSQVPTTVPTSGSETLSTATTLLVGSAVDVGDVGFVKVGSEWIRYSGVTRGSSTVTLNNLERALYGTTAATHAISSNVVWGVAADDVRLWTQLYDQVTARIHELQLHKSTTEDTIRHEKLVFFYDRRASEFWRREGYVTQGRPKLVLKQSAMGNRPWM